MIAFEIVGYFILAVVAVVAVVVVGLMIVGWSVGMYLTMKERKTARKLP